MENLLPIDITLNIFSRLPAESVLECRRVRKAWRTLTYHPSFSDMHLRRQLQQLKDNATTKVSFIFLVKEYRKLLYYGEYDVNNDDGKQPNDKKILTRINHPPLGFDYDFVGSCNGLICLSVYHPYTQDPVYICNPITRECINIPIVRDLMVSENNKPGSTHYQGRLVSGFGYDHSTNEYKVVRIYYDVCASSNHVCVYTLGGATGWRNIGDCSFSVYTSGTFVNGALHWLEHQQNKIVAFDLADENFRVLPSPPYEFLESELVVLGGCLSLFHYTESQCIDIWSFKNKSYCCNNSKEVYDQSWSWTKDFSINIVEGDREQCIHGYRPFAIRKKDEVLFWSSNKNILARYDPKTANFEKLVDYDAQGMNIYETITHMNSLVSLKSLGENAKKIG